MTVKHRLITSTLCLIAAVTLLASPAADAQVQRDDRARQQPNRAQPRQRGLPQGTTAHRNLVYATAPVVNRDAPKKMLLDLYLPAAKESDENKPLPLVVWIHGGGWRGGSKNFCRALPLVAHGYAVASISYRLSNEAVFPAQIHDCKAAIRYLRANAAKYNLDPKRVAVWGSSAGGHLVALLGTSGDVKDLEGNLGNNDQSSRVQAVCNYFGPTDLARMMPRNNDGLADRPARPARPGGHPVELLLGGSLPEKAELAKAASPVTHITKDDPPFITIHGSEDRLVPVKQAHILHDGLQKAGVKSKLEVIEGAGHGFRGQAGTDAQAMVVKFFAANL